MNQHAFPLHSPRGGARYIVWDDANEVIVGASAQTGTLVDFNESRRNWRWTDKVRPGVDGSQWFHRTIQPRLRSKTGKRILTLIGAGVYSASAAMLVVTILSALTIGATYCLRGAPSSVVEIRDVSEVAGLLAVVTAYGVLGHFTAELANRYEAAARLVDLGAV